MLVIQNIFYIFAAKTSSPRRRRQKTPRDGSYLYDIPWRKQHYKERRNWMDNTSLNINDFLMMTVNYSAIKEAVCLLSNQTLIECILNEELSAVQLNMLINRIESSIGELSNLSTLLYIKKDTFLKTFFPKSYKPFNSAQELLDMPAMEELGERCSYIKEESDIQETNATIGEKHKKREQYVKWHKLLDKLYPSEENENLTTTLQKRILYFHRILTKTITLMREITDTENSYRMDKEICFSLFNEQLESLQNEADRLIKEGHYSKDDLGWAKNPLVTALHGKNLKDKLPNLYHAYPSKGVSITENQMLEYAVYKRLQDTSPSDGSLSKEMAEQLTLVKGDPVKEQKIKRIIQDLPKIFTKLEKNEKGKYKINGFTIAAIIILAGEHAKQSNIFNYFKSIYDTPSSYGNISTNIRGIKDGKESKDDKSGNRKKYMRYKKLHDVFVDFYQEETVSSY